MQKVNRYEASKRPDEFRSLAWATPMIGDDGKKRHRRTAGEIDRHYKCPVRGCGKSYGLTIKFNTL